MLNVSFFFFWKIFIVFGGFIYLSIQDLPIRAWQEHTREVFSVDWSNLKKDTFASSSWDGTIKLVSRKLSSQDDTISKKL